ncbi:MAG: flagellar biosynthesis anti-sigma factor FlgM [Epsilonproteobacteria bacterium]|nr:flagellar biosynthesis anti-sigma factor FlgM [Campylobacterota bacterium]OIO16650.1 MAG: flagellar biosynthesis protein FlgM [Helicobacteraceae bacterium CG1_02_36_14]PIP09839.1 MAG: flagellar biosynthesis protein FlgM [Sulfurimonas sp. CG23_combo_of_CG06-09_8_20_14_all_36_33]PIS24054.1 MAG: flagellar biosynthesis protein FlgM [Sulfurimonas sp. CG08_land_8_20_14_0_20_36_33]PIU35538.1 MAG: flagellar biosynthesis protein FlgM [Sulfurimonas sp. CG07_land_8_20_14_0_80_36_56]PIV05459.1 MAG: fla
MISQLNSLAAKNAYASRNSESKTENKESVNISKQGDMSKVDKIKESLSAGEYKIDLQQLSEKIAEALL